MIFWNTEQRTKNNAIERTNEQTDVRPVCQSGFLQKRAKKHEKLYYLVIFLVIFLSTSLEEWGRWGCNALRIKCVIPYAVIQVSVLYFTLLKSELQGN
jgi:hypothetical protein